MEEKLVSLANKLPQKYFHGKNNVKVAGDYISNSKNSSYVFDVQELEECKFINIGNKIKDCYDAWAIVDNVERNYENISHNSSNSCFTYSFWSGHHGFYADTCEGCSNVFGCIGLRNKQYCILNKQYTKEEYEALVPKIIAHMNAMPYADAKGRIYRYGEFFPSELSPFAYNETIAQEYFPLSKAEAEANGYRFRDSEERNYQISISSAQLPDHIKEVKEDITKEVIECAHKGECNHQCTTAFKVIPEELAFYRRMNLPLPRLCPNCRHYERLSQRNPLKLWHRTCQCTGKGSESGTYQNTATHHHGEEKCSNEFETSYAPDRKEVVYCEQCYQAEVV
jgi:hypothetical protein